jgi:hypothetical protein
MNQKPLFFLADNPLANAFPMPGTPGMNIPEFVSDFKIWISDFRIPAHPLP